MATVRSVQDQYKSASMNWRKAIGDQRMIKTTLVLGG